MDFIKINQHCGLVPVERTFICAYCNTKVDVVDEKDKRYKYCCQKCEKQYWRKKSKENSIYKKRGREKNVGFRNYSAKEFAIKLWIERKERGS